MTTSNNGPLLTDRRFFCDLLQLDGPGMEALKPAAQACDFAACRRLFAELVRKTLRPALFFKGQDAPEATDELLKKAEDACRHHMESCGFATDFDGPVDWFSNPTYNGYKEWTWQLSRHDELATLARAYRATGDERYAAACAELFDSWVKQAITPPEGTEGWETKCWRTIECGIRQGLVWPGIIHSVLHSPAFTDDILVDWCKSVWEHGRRLRHEHRTGNWLIMEMNGLAHIGLLYPFFKQSAEWLDYAVQKLVDELKLQLYPDGFQYELSTCYQLVVIRNYMSTLRLLRLYDHAVDPALSNGILQMVMVYVKLMQPGGNVPDINDGDERNVAETVVAPVADLYPDDPVLRWVLTGGTDGKEPDEVSAVFPYAGQAALRTDWTPNATWVYLDGGPFGVAHQHEDKLSLLMYADGQYTLTEGNRYAYDTSEMRAYGLSTRAHNTVRVDGMDQNRRDGYAWKGENNRESGLLSRLSDECDALRAVYDEGYGPEKDGSVTHERSVYLLKRQAGLRPFVVVVDRLRAAQAHDYEVMWHLDAPRLACDGMQVTANTLHLLTPEAPMETAGMTVSRGVQFPEWQGWKCNSTVQKDFRPIYNVSYWLHAAGIRWVTVLYPDGGEACPVTAVEASLKPDDTQVTLRLRDGGTVTLDERALL